MIEKIRKPDHKTIRETLKNKRKKPGLKRFAKHKNLIFHTMIEQDEIETR